MSKIRYVVMVVVDPETRVMATLVKRKGPAFLLGKVCFPGGKLEPGELPRQAASREMLEECGVRIPEQAWVKAALMEGEGYQLNVLASRSAEVLAAHTCEEEEVALRGVAEHRQLAVQNPLNYCPDFLDLLAVSLEKLQQAR